PVFVDEYSELEVKRFPHLSEEELGTYLACNVEALRAAVAWFGGVDAAIVGHAVAGPAIAHRALGAGAYVAKLHGSDLEYAVRLQERYRALAEEGLVGARAVVGTSDDVIARARSEERRVGKERRSRGWPEDGKDTDSRPKPCG